jgi:hypothetical protein
MLILIVAATLCASLSRGSTALVSDVQDVSAEAPPMALQQIGDSSVAVFDEALAGRWDDVSLDLAGMSRRLVELPAHLPYPDVVAELRSRLHALHDDVAARSTASVLDDANAVSRLVTQIADGFEVTVPFEVAILPYYGRQLEVGVMRGRLMDLQKTIRDLRAMWTRAEPIVLMRGDADDARRFTDVVVDLDAARRVEDVEPLARNELRVAASINQTFRSGS